MASLKDLRNRIASVKATQKITKAMQMVAAAKLRRAQMAAEAARPYAERMERVLANLASGLANQPDAPLLLSGTGSTQRHLLIVATAERGLAGAFNSSIARLARDHANRLIAEGKDVTILPVGRKGADVLRRQFANRLEGNVDLRDVKQLGFVNAEAIATQVISRFEAGEFDVATLFFSRFRSVIQQVPTAQQIIPAVIPQVADTGASALYEFEPGEAEILQDLLPRNIAIQIFRALLENAASEQGARMSAMDNATRNAGDMIKKLTMNYNRTRQAQITKELIEIISGAEAL
ncbi:F0F1 ATP synthase subunit gamma [Terrihabitans rhizophilus]|uniref:ATP synthase gamma chain n=1 Tax=Terrihabitans rhizophilus TaxID=3092662 RepID=A0ABU4RMR4_9HYPH|nr:F0F1 ATP synthase subunit gamma [Terrihabitans sp. PJ23]MDX6806121.1 F0F1 ATP synthase subunit gamma [Terrihabitans sp. PJ23]